MKSKIDFAAGYYEWIVYVNNEAVFAFDDLLENIHEAHTRQDFISLVENLIDGMLFILNDKEERGLYYSHTTMNEIDQSTINILKANRNSLRKNMIQTLINEYGLN